MGATALVCLPLFILLAVWSRLTPVAGWELQLSAGLRLPAEPLVSLIALLNLLGELIVWLPLVLGLIVAGLILRQLVAAGLLALTITSDLAAALTKVLVERSRPAGALVEHFLGEESFAFPSGHVVRVTALLAVLAWLLAPVSWRVPLAVAAGAAGGLLMGYARVASGVHWPSDVLGGLLLGLGWFGATGWLLLSRRAN